MYKKSKAYSIEICCGEERHCSHKLSNISDIAKKIDTILKEVNFEKFLLAELNGTISRRYKLSIALAACPNACSRPQIKGIGLVADIRPVSINNKCNGCEKCVEKCNEHALTLKNKKVVFDNKKCVGCGDCISACKKRAIDSSSLRMHLFTGGRLGRHPRLGDEHKHLIENSMIPEVVKKNIMKYMNDCDIKKTTFFDFISNECTEIYK